MQDILAHVTTWEEEALRYLPRILEGGTPPRYSTTYGGIDAFNAQMTARKARLSAPRGTGTGRRRAPPAGRPGAERSGGRDRQRHALPPPSTARHVQPLPQARRGDPGVAGSAGDQDAVSAASSARSAARVAAGMRGHREGVGLEPREVGGREAKILDERGQLLAQRATEHGGVVGIDREPHAPLVQPAKRVRGQVLTTLSLTLDHGHTSSVTPSAARRSTSAASSTARTPCSIRARRAGRAPPPRRRVPSARRRGPWSAGLGAAPPRRPRRRPACCCAVSSPCRLMPVEPGRAQHRLDHRGRRALGLVLRERGEDAHDQARRLRGLDGRRRRRGPASVCSSARATSKEISA